MARVKFNPETLRIVLNGVTHAIVEVQEQGKIMSGPNAGKPCTRFGVLNKKSNCLWRGQLYYGWSANSFVQDRFDKLEGHRP